MRLTNEERDALRLMVETGGFYSAAEWRAMGMPGAGIKLNILSSLGMADRKGAWPVLYRVSAMGRNYLEEEQT